MRKYHKDILTLTYYLQQQSFLRFISQHLKSERVKQLDLLIGLSLVQAASQLLASFLILYIINYFIHVTGAQYGTSAPCSEDAQIL